MPKAGYTQLSYYQKLHLKEMLEEKRYTKIKMAEKLHVSKSTIYNEIKRGTINGVYDPKYSERKRSESRSGSMFDKNPELALYISRLIIEEHMSPEMIIKQLKNEPDKFEKYPTSPTTIYSAIEDGGIPGVSKEQLNLMQNMNVVKVFSDSIHLPLWLRKKLQINDGDRYRIECCENGDIVLRRLKGN